MKAEEKLDQEVDRLWQQMRYAYEHGGGHAGHLNNAWHTAMRLSKELLRLRAENERLVAEVANRNRRALEGDEAVTALANVHKHYENEVRVLTETLQRCKEVGDATAEHWRMDAERLRALESDPDYDYCHRLAILLECMTLDSHRSFDDACALLDEYYAARDKWAQAQGQPRCTIEKVEY